ncbi:MAG: PQQ-dependent sugar dehydrogenase [Rhodospirillales bacterium]
MRLITLGIVFFASAMAWAAPASAAIELDKIKLPPGFEISVLADKLPTARGMALGPKGTLFVGSFSAGNVYALTLAGDHVTKVRTVIQALTMPVGVAFNGTDLYVSSLNMILRYVDIESHLDLAPAGMVVRKDFPDDKHHGWKFIAFGPDGMLYVPVGAPCNICEPDPKRYANISRMKPDGSGVEVFAHGVRNSVGFDWDPRTKDLWFTDNGRDMMGDDMPSDELNHAPKADMHFGYPYCHQGDTPDPEFAGKHSCIEFTPPAQKLGAHVAALGMRFYTGAMFPAEYKNNIFIAQHGSWNRSKKSGYRVMRAVVEGDKVIKYEVFAEGWLQGETNWAGPSTCCRCPTARSWCRMTSPAPSTA